MELFNCLIDLIVAICDLLSPPKNELDALRRIHNEQIRNNIRNNSRGYRK